jgi:hypothetical protein
MGVRPAHWDTAQAGALSDRNGAARKRPRGMTAWSFSWSTAGLAAARPERERQRES